MTAFWITTLAGLATLLGAALALAPRGPDAARRWLPRGLAFAAGVMLCVSLFELIPEAVSELRHGLGGFSAGVALLVALTALATGALGIHLLDHSSLLPRPHGSDGFEQPGSQSNALTRVSLLTALSLGVHNFPEGMAVFVSNLDGAANPGGLALAVAVAVHNIPEGLAVALPVLLAGGSRLQALGLAALSGLAEPLGAVLAWAALAPFLSPAVLGLVFAAVAGMMLYISLKTLLPAALSMGPLRESGASLLSGAAAMAFALFAI